MFGLRNYLTLVVPGLGLVGNGAITFLSKSNYNIILMNRDLPYWPYL